MTTDFFLNLDSDSIVEYFKDKREENATVEYKQGTADIEKLYKEICAFANTDGGTLIYGTPEEQKEKSRGVISNYCRGEIIPSQITKSADDLLSSIGSNIAPMPHGVKIKRISLERGSVYIIIVPKSNKKPHQYNGTYYIRINTKSAPAPHGIVEMMFNQKAEIDLYLTVGNFHEHDVRYNSISLILSNKTNIPAQKVEIYFTIIGNVMQVVDKSQLEENIDDYELLRIRLNSGKFSLSKFCNFTHAVIDKISTWYVAQDIRILEEYCYMKVVYWAEGVPSKVDYFKIHSNTNIAVKHLNFEMESAEKKEYFEWAKELEEK